MTHVAKAKVVYSASEEDLDTVICFLLVLHEINDLPRKKHRPEIERLVSTHISYPVSITKALQM